MKRLLLLAALASFAALAQPFNANNNPNLPGYVNPSQQRMQNQMLNQQQQQKSMLNMQLQNQSQRQQQYLQNQLNNDRQRVIQSQPGQLNPQPLPNSGGGMLNSSGTP